MKISLKMFLTTVLIAFSLPVFAVTSSFHNRYVIYIDAGSSGSRLHIMEYQRPTDGSMPVINEVASYNVSPGLSSPAFKTPKEAADSLNPLFDQAKKYVQAHFVMLVVPVNLYATAGMRSLPEAEQQAIYDNVKNNLQPYQHFAVGEIKTIPGNMEGLYGWLDVNYLAGNFQKHLPTIGSIDMGGASTQIAFETNDPGKQHELITLNINNQLYTVFSTSFLGLGQDQARETMTNMKDAINCYPQGYTSGIGGFDLEQCKKLYNKIIEKHDVVNQIPPVKGEFIAYSGIYYAYRFFNAIETPDMANLQANIRNVCTRSWAQLQQEYPGDKYLSGYCANASYLDQLLYNAYQLQGYQLTVSNQVNNKAIDWTLGAALYGLTQH